MKKVAFDIDGCICDIYGRTNENIVALIKFFHGLGCTVYIWTGGGINRAESVVNNLGLNDIATPAVKGTVEVDVAFDDMKVKLAEINIQVCDRD